MDNDFGVQTRLTYKQIMKNLIIVLVLAIIVITVIVHRIIAGPEREIRIEDQSRIKLTGQVVQAVEHRKYITVEIKNKKFEESINILVYSPLREKLQGIAPGDLLKFTAFKISRRYKQSYEANKVKLIKAKPKKLDDGL